MKLETGSDIRAERNRCNVAQSWLAKKIDVSPNLLRAIETEDLPISPELADKIRSALASVAGCAA